MTTQNGNATAEQVGKQKEKPAIQTEVAKDLAKDALKQEARLDTGTTPKEEDETPSRYQLEGTNLLEPYLSMGLNALEEALNPKSENAIGDDVVERILILERNGPNRTENVKLLCKRLGFKPKDIFKELPQAGGPDFTNDTTNLSDL